MISVAMTTYQGERYVEKQLESILHQTLVPDEIIICDDGSKDGTVDVIRRIAETEPRIQLICNEKNLGYRKNFKKVISLTKGDLIFLADQDDEWLPEKIETMVQIMREKGCEALCSDYALIDENSELLDRNQFQIHPFIRKTPEDGFAEIRFGKLIFGNILQGCTYCFTGKVRDAYLKLDNTDVDHDQQIMFTAALCGTVLFYKHVLIRYRIHSSNAIGIAEKGEQEGLELRKPSKKPFMVQFLEDLDEVLPVRNKGWYSLLFYLRIPYLAAHFRK